jgi:RyR domain
MTTETTTVAKMCHAANKTWCELHGDFSQPAWDDAPDWQKNSAIQGVEFHRANPAAGDSASHDNWMALKVAEGWVYGDVKDPEAKTHPCIVPFDALPHMQRKKDAIFRAMVHALGD